MADLRYFLASPDGVTVQTARAFALTHFRSEFPEQMGCGDTPLAYFERTLAREDLTWVLAADDSGLQAVYAAEVIDGVLRIHALAMAAKYDNVGLYREINAAMVQLVTWDTWEAVVPDTPAIEMLAALPVGREMTREVMPGGMIRLTGGRPQEFLEHAEVELA